jgi:5-methylcytosine-specific restriction endonuclease McrA
VKRAVWERDGRRCAFIGKTGRRCNSTWCVQEHHVIPRALGGEYTVENIQLRSAAHNRYEADQAYGPANKLKYAGVVSEARASYAAGGRTRSGPSSGAGVDTIYR